MTSKRGFILALMNMVKNSDCFDERDKSRRECRQRRVGMFNFCCFHPLIPLKKSKKTRTIRKFGALTERAHPGRLVLSRPGRTSSHFSVNPVITVAPKRSSVLWEAESNPQPSMKRVLTDWSELKDAVTQQLCSSPGGAAFQSAPPPQLLDLAPADAIVITPCV